MLLVITFRPEFQPPWGGQAHVTSLALNRLGERDGAALVQTLAGNAALSPDIVAEIVERADGVPLFVEELTKAVLESAPQGDQVAALLATTSLTALSVPATLHASLMARLDRLGPAAKEVAQIGAVLGREFAYELIEPVAQRHANELQAALGQLSDAGLLFCRGTAPHASYLFKHALVQDAAYSMLLRERRQVLHARVATALEKHFPDLLERQPELLAYHLTAAGNTERAVDQWLKAGQYAAAHLAHLEAVRHFERGLATLTALPAGPARDRPEIELQLARGLCAVHGGRLWFGRGGRGLWPRPRTRRTAGRLAPAVHRQSMASGNRPTARAGLDCRSLSNRLQQLTAGKADDEVRLQAHHSAWSTCIFAGELAGAREHCEAGRRLYDPERHRSHRLLYGGHDPGVCARKVGGQVYWLLGYPEKGLALGNESLALAERIAHPFTLVDALVANAVLQVDCDASEVALQRLNAAEALAVSRIDRAFRARTRNTAWKVSSACCTSPRS